VNWVLDADIRGFFETISHEKLLKMIEHRIGDRRIYALVWKWLRAGVLDGTRWKASEEGTPQGGLVSPVLANIYLHYVFDLWAHHWRTHNAHGDVIIVRYADDFVVGFEHREDAERFKAELAERLREYSLELHADKTRLIEFGRHAAANRRRRGERKPETFNFLGFTHICGKTRKGRFTVMRRSMRTRMLAKLKAIKVELEWRRHLRIPEQGRWLGKVVSGYVRYHGVPGNYASLARFRWRITTLWRSALLRRSQKAGMPWDRMRKIAARWLPTPKICHPYPSERLRVTT
jgi:group II intron reverse transcriptase/maturase